MAMSGAGRWLLRHTIKKTGRRTFDNFFTGYEYTKPAKLIGGTAIVAGVGTYETLFHHQRPIDEWVRATAGPDIESLPMSRADQLGYRMPQSQVEGFGEKFTASGDLVFALHNLRNGGYL